MSEPLSTNVLLARHKAYLPSHSPFPTIAELGPLSKIPHILVVTCADPRCTPESFLGINPGEILVIRNAGGNPQMALPNILALDALVDIHEIMVVKHTDCGSLVFTEKGVKGVLKQRPPMRELEIDEMDIGSIAGKTLEQGLREQVGFVKGSDLVKAELKQNIRSFIFDIASGKLTEVQA
jgi:carbonic anhydrase